MAGKLTREMINRMRNLLDALLNQDNTVGGLKRMTDAEFEFFCGAQQIVPSMFDILDQDPFAIFDPIIERDSARLEYKAEKAKRERLEEANERLMTFNKGLNDKLLETQSLLDEKTVVFCDEWRKEREALEKQLADIVKDRDVFIGKLIEVQARAIRAEVARDAAISDNEATEKKAETWATRAMIAETQRDAAIRKFEQHISRLEAILPDRTTRLGNPIEAANEAIINATASLRQCHICGALRPGNYCNGCGNDEWCA